MKHFVAAAIICLMSMPAAASECVESTREVYLMGTTAMLTSCAADRESGLAQLETFILILEDAERELSTWIEDSAISRLNRHPLDEPFKLTDQLKRLFADLFEWQEKTGGAFDPGIGALTSVWRIHKEGRTPSASELDQARRESGLRHFVFDPSRDSLTRKNNVTIDVGGFGKGEGLDRVLDYARAHKAAPFLIDIGGQVAVYATQSKREWTVDLAHPAARGSGVIALLLKGGSLSTSSGSERDLNVDGVRIGHILDPRNGVTVVRDLSVVVWHESALIADMLSTALFVMGEAEGLAWADANGVAACFLVPAEENRVETRQSKAWTAKLADPHAELGRSEAGR